MSDWYRCIVDGPFNVTVAGHTLRARPSASDIPSAFQVNATRDPPSLKITFFYAVGMDERTASLTFDTTSVTIGENSRRLFSIEIRGVRGASASELARALASVMGKLAAKTPLAGPHVNYEAARRGLRLDQGERSETPTWMADALKRLRESSDPRALR